MSLVEEPPFETIDPETVKLEDFWAIDPAGLAWMFVLKNLTKDAQTNGKEFIIGVKPDMTFRYFLNKKVFPAEAVAKVIGCTPEALIKAKVITLLALERHEPKDTPKPTVDYYGEA